jgi:hypothetical protein
MEDCLGGAARLAPSDWGGALRPAAAPALVRALGRHHAAHWDSPLLPLWSWLPLLDAPLIARYEPDLCAAALGDALTRFGHELPPSLRDALPGLPAAARGPLLRRLASRPRTLLHGDVRPGRVLAPLRLLASGEGAADVRLANWGDCAAGRGPHDVARLLASAMLPEERSEAEHSLLAEYHEALQEGGVTAYSMYDCWEDYKYGVAYSLVGAVADAGAPGLVCRPLLPTQAASRSDSRRRHAGRRRTGVGRGTPAAVANSRGGA